MHAFRVLEAIIAEPDLKKRQDMLRDWETHQCPTIFGAYEVNIHELEEAKVSKINLEAYSRECVLQQIASNDRLPVRWKTEPGIDNRSVIFTGSLYTLKWDYK